MYSTRFFIYIPWYLKIFHLINALSTLFKRRILKYFSVGHFIKHKPLVSEECIIIIIHSNKWFGTKGSLVIVGIYYNISHKVSFVNYQLPLLQFLFDAFVTDSIKSPYNCQMHYALKQGFFFKIWCNNVVLLLFASLMMFFGGFFYWNMPCKRPGVVKNFFKMLILFWHK